MAVKSCYEVLEVAPTASHDDIRRAFRRALAKYHPDKLQHLGAEFQDIAAARTAAITKAYRTLSDPAARVEHDARTMPGAVPPTESSPGRWGFSTERTEAGELVRRAALGRLRQALQQEFGACEGTPVHGFDVAGVSPKGEIWRRGHRLRVLGRLVPAVDATAVEEGWASAERLARDDRRDVCLFLMGQILAPAEELGRTIDGLRRRRARTRGALIVVPVDIRTWAAHVPEGAPSVVSAIVQRLRAA